MPIFLPISSMFFIYFVFKISVKQFIYKQLKSVYQSTLFKYDSSVNKDYLETDFENILERINKFAQTKHQEIEKLHNIDDFRRDFLGNVSHELKTPVFNIQGYIESLIDGGLRDEKINMKYLQRASRNVDRLTKIIEDLEVISLIENNAFNLEFDKFNICELAGEVLDSMNIMAENSRIHLGFKNPGRFSFSVYAKANRKLRYGRYSPTKGEYEKALEYFQKLLKTDKKNKRF